MGLVVGAEHVAARSHQHGTVEDDARLRATLVGAVDQVDAELLPRPRAGVPSSDPEWSSTRCHRSPAGRPGENPVVHVSGSTTSSAPVSPTHRRSHSTAVRHVDLDRLLREGGSQRLYLQGRCGEGSHPSLRGLVVSRSGTPATGQPPADQRTDSAAAAPDDGPTAERRHRPRRLRCSRLHAAGGRRLLPSARTARSAYLIRIGRLARDGFSRSRGQRRIDGAEELGGGLLRDPGDHALADSPDHAADHRVGVVRQSGRRIAAVLEANQDLGAERAGCTGAGRVQHEAVRMLLVAEADLTLVGRP